MKKIHKLFLIATIALGLGFVACSDSDVVSQGVDDAKTNTHVSVTLKMSTNASTRALPKDYNYLGEWAGKDKIETITVYLVDGLSVTAKTFEVGAEKPYSITEDGGTLVPANENAAIKTTAGTKKVYVLINGVEEITSKLNMTPVEDFEEAYHNAIVKLGNSGTSETVKTSASKLAMKNDADNEKIVMTNVEPNTLVVEPKITAAQTIGATPKNRVSLEVERAVARVMVTIKQDTPFNVTRTGGDVIGTISDVTWVAAQGENSLYIQRKSAWETPSFGWVPTDNAEYIADAGDRYDYSGLFENQGVGFGGTVVATMTDYAGNDAHKEGKVTKELNDMLSGKFVLPTTHAVGEKAASSYKKGNTPYVLIRALFTPKVFADGETYTAGHDFYVGGNGKFYTSAANAVTVANGGVTGQTVAKYEKGKVLYYAWLNPDNVAEPYNSPVLRNNIYHIHITGFKNLGTNWNPLFPEDPENPILIPDPNNPGEFIPSNPDPKPTVPTVEIPNPDYDPEDPESPPTIDVPDPDYPEEPTNPIDPEDPLTTPVTYMSVDVTVLPWLVHSYSVDLGM